MSEQPVPPSAVPPCAGGPAGPPVEPSDGAHDHEHDDLVPGVPRPIDPAELPEPRTPQDAMEQARTRIAATADARGEGWAALATLMEEPTEEVVAALRDGTTAKVLTEATAWLGADSPMVGGPLMSLEVFVRGAHRRTAEKDMRSLTEDREAVADVVGKGAQAALAAPMRELAALCHHEARAWAAGDDARGKELRARQREVADADLSEKAPGVAKALVEEGAANLSRTIGRLVLGFLSAETGRDYQRAVLGDARGRSHL